MSILYADDITLLNVGDDCDDLESMVKGSLTEACNWVMFVLNEHQKQTKINVRVYIKNNSNSRDLLKSVKFYGIMVDSRL